MGTYSYNDVRSNEEIAFATDENGSPVVYEWASRNPQLLIMGRAGSGKTTCMQTLVAGALSKGAQVYIGDLSNDMADFQFASRWAQCETSIPALATMVTEIENEVRRRLSLLTSDGPESLSELPHMVLALDDVSPLVSQKEDDGFNEQRQEVSQRVGFLANCSRNAKLSLLLGVQGFTIRGGLASSPGAMALKTMADRILLGHSSYEEQASSLMSPPDEEEYFAQPGPPSALLGGAIYEKHGHMGRVQVYHEEQSELENFIENERK